MKDQVLVCPNDDTSHSLNTVRKCMLSLVTELSLVVQAKESWEMNTVEKLEQSSVVKEKGTQYFKVRPPLWLH